MNKIHIATSLFVMLSLGACAEQKSNLLEGHLRGSEEFKNVLRLGAGANRPALPQAGSSLSLTGDDVGVVSIALDPAADIWSRVSFDTSRQNLINADQSLVEWSRNYILQHKAEIGLDVSELSSFSNTLVQPTAELIFVTFLRNFQDREVRGAFVQLIFAVDKDGYRLREINNNSFGPMALKGESSPAIKAQTAIDATGIATLEATAQKALIYPQLGADGRYEFRFATEWVLADQEHDEKYHVIMDDDSQAILAAHSNHFHVKQQLTMETFKNSYVTKEIAVVPLAGARVDTAVADAQGVIDSAAATGTVTLVSSRGNVISLTGNQANTATYSFPVTYGAGGLTKVALGGTVDSASLNAFAALNEVNTWVGRFLTPQQAPALTMPIPVKVNVVGPRGSEYCNAFFDGASLNFFAQGAIGNTTCANTATIKDVMYHEWGHYLDNTVGIQPGITDGAFSEGIGDINATLATGNPILGAGFVFNDANSSVRTVNNTRVYPPATAAEAEVHSAGQIIGGAFWDLRQNLVAIYGPDEGTARAASLFFKHLLVTDRYIDSYTNVLLLDDTDKNTATPSPSYCAINKAFGKHKLIGTSPLEGDSCVDQDQGLKVRVDTDNGGGSLNLVASSFGASSISFCPGKVTTCPVGPTTVQFTKLADPAPSVLNTTKKFYQASATVTVKAGEMYTLISKDANGKSLGLKALNFGARDQSTDLSKTFKVQ